MAQNRKLFAPNFSPAQLKVQAANRAARDAKSQQTMAKMEKQSLNKQTAAYLTGQMSQVINPASKLGKALVAAQYFNDKMPAGYQINSQNLGRLGNNIRRVATEKIEPVFRGNPNPVESNGQMNVMNASYGLSKAPNPKKIMLNSGIAPNTYANDYMPVRANLCSPMHVAGITFQIPSTGTIWTYWLNTIAFDIQTRAQSNVSYNLDVANTFSAAKILTAFNAALNALQIYYYYSSILSYESDPRNKNEAMIALRQGITPQILSDLAQLGRRLEDTPVPPRLVEMMRYMNGNFLSGDSQGSPLLKICFNPKVLNGTLSITGPAAALTALNTAENNAVYALVRSAIPQWRTGTLYDVPTIPTFDKNFITIFANLPSFTSSNVGTVYSVPFSTGTTTSISYNSFSNVLDGMAFAMTSIYNVTTSAWAPGFTIPVSDGVANDADSRWSWYTINGTDNTWVKVVGNQFLIDSRQESWSKFAATGAAITPHLFGAEKCQAVTIEALNQTTQNVLDFLFNVKSIPVKGKLSHFNKKALLI